MGEKVQLDFRFKDKRCYTSILINNIEVHVIECDNMTQGRKLAVYYLFDLLGDIHYTIYNAPESKNTSDVVMTEQDICIYEDFNTKFHANKIYIDHLFLEHYSVYTKRKLGISELMQYFTTMRHWMDKMERFLYSLTKEK